MKNGDKGKSATGMDQSFAADGIFRSPGNPRAIKPGVNSAGAFSYGAHHALFAANFGHDPSQGAPNAGVSASVVDAPADLVMLMEKGANAGGNNNDWNYPWFHDWQQQWVGSILGTAGDPSTITRDGVDVYTPGSSVYSPKFDSDCVDGLDGGAWECAAHARYRFTGSAPMSFVDGHAKAIHKGAIKWFKNIWLDRRNLNHYSWYYGYMNDGGWGFPGIH